MGAATDNAFGGRGTFHSSWAKEELDAEPPLGDHFDSLGLAVCEEEIKNVTKIHLSALQCAPKMDEMHFMNVSKSKIAENQ